MKLQFKLTCNPWTDRGVTIFADLMASREGIVRNIDINPGKVVVSFYEEATREQIVSILAEMLRMRQEAMFVPNSLSRALAFLKRDVAKTDEEGRRTGDLTVTVSKDDIVELKKRNITSVKPGENKIYRLTASYPGMPADLRGILEKSDLLAEQVVEEMAGEPQDRANFCIMSESPTKHLEALTQSLHVFANKHHNATVRGFGAGNGYFKVGAAWRYALAFSATEPYHPFFESRDTGTRLLLPVVNDFEFLLRLHHHFKRNLQNIQDFNYPTSSTNIRDLYGSDSYSGLVSLLHSLYNNLTITDSSEDILAPTEVRRLTQWTVGQFKRATYVSFGTFHTIEVDERLFDYIKPLPYQRKDFEPEEYQIVPDVLNRIKWPDAVTGERFSRVLVESNLSKMKMVIWEIYKSLDRFGFYPGQKGRPAPQMLFNDFIMHFVKENTNNMDSEIRGAAKDMGRLVGRTFPRDLTLLSRIYNIHDVNELRDAIKTVLFRLEKEGVEQSRHADIPDYERLYPIRNRPFEVLLDAIGPDNFREIADIFSIFASLNAFNANVGSKTDGDTNITRTSAFSTSDNISEENDT